MDHREHDLPAGDQVDLASLLFGTGLMSAMSLRDRLLRALDAAVRVGRGRAGLVGQRPMHDRLGMTVGLR
jgi:hypothetical protein